MTQPNGLQPDRRIIIDVTDFVDFMVKSNAVSGIQRVIAALTNQETDPHEVIYSVCTLGAFRRIPFEIGQRPIDAIEKYIAWKRAIRTLRTRQSSVIDRLQMITPSMSGFKRHLLHRINFQATDSVVILGAVWNKAALLKKLAKAKRAHGFSVSVFVHDVIPIFGERFVSFRTYSNFGAYLRWVDDIADNLICNSFYSKADLVRTKRVSRAHEADVILLAHEFPEIEARDAQESFARAQAFVEDQCMRYLAQDFVLCVGTIEARKNQVELVQVWTDLSREQPMPLLILVGAQGQGADAVKIMLDRDNPPIAILDTANDAMLQQLYTDCRFTIFPSLYEGWGLPVGESLWFQKPCLASNSSSIPEAAGGHAISFDPTSRADMISKIKDLLAGGIEPKLPTREKLRTWRQVADDLMEHIRHKAKLRAES